MYNFFLEWRVCLLLPGEKGGKKREGRRYKAKVGKWAGEVKKMD